jgi:transposase
MLAIMGESLAPDAVAPPPEAMEDLQELVRGRQSIVEDRTGLLNRIGESKTAALIGELKRQLRAADAAIAKLETEIKRRIKADPALARRFEILTSIPGLGLVAAATLIAELNEIGQLSAKQVAMIVGLAPIASDSGQRAGAREIKGGRKHLRNALYMPAQSAAQHNPDFKIFYDRLIENGKLAKVAITAVMRKLVVLANTLVRQDRTWTPNLA